MDVITYSKLLQLQNKIDSTYTFTQDDMESGKWLYTEKQSDTKRIRTGKPVFVRKGTKIEYLCANLDIYIGISKTLKSGSTGFVTTGWLTSSAQKRTYTLAADGYLMLTFKKPSGETISVTDYDCTIQIIKDIKYDLDDEAESESLILINGNRPEITSYGAVYTIKIDGYPRVVWNRGILTPSTEKVTQTLTIDTNGTLVYYPSKNTFEVIENGHATLTAGGLVICCVVMKGVIFGQWAKFYSGDAELIPLYYKSHLATKLSEILAKAMLVGKQGGRAIFVTDYHIENNTRHTGELVKYLMQNTGIRTMIFGGDAIQSETTASAGYAKLVEYTKDFSGVMSIGKLISIIGNHEENNPSGDPEYESRMVDTGVIYQLFTNGSNGIHPLWNGNNDARSYYMDDDMAKVRYYFVGCDYKALLPEDDVKGIANSLLDVPEGFAVIVFSHIGIRWNSTAGEATYSSGNFPKLLSCISALNNGTSVTVSYTGSSETYDYTNKARTVVGVICGHCHYDAVVVYDSKVPIISTTTDAYSLPVNPVDGSRPARSTGTADEQAFDVVQFDVETKRIYMTRIGGGDDRVIAFGENAGIVS